MPPEVAPRRRRPPPIPAQLLVRVTNPRLRQILQVSVMFFAPTDHNSVSGPWQVHHVPPPPEDHVYLFTAVLDLLDEDGYEETWAEYFIGEPASSHPHINLRHASGRDLNLVITVPGTYRLTVSVTLDTTVPNFSNGDMTGEFIFHVGAPLNRDSSEAVAHIGFHTSQCSP
ncbi:hypothetical protein BGW36DRAFT_364284 [Talaromyces proteolyticus]|uniref:Uncharacterized protein n=1 Tax=Talaromyces proteolyticus TaxID=1131652 RepID=A0AAD4KKU2_9EURO|nr:uncharacterized protein BGW36DRAFT_364284 [Talaromyces proteolyticus]KAH8690718.1 hypothetical protein BGW36DRAFT_364284 [Talaromyces proteolyticus]